MTGSTIMYFAYGSNMDSNRLHNRIGDVSSSERAYLSRFQFQYNKLSYKLDRVYANIMPENHSVVWGVLIEVDEAQLDKLDDDEGVENGHYRREKVTVVTDQNIEIEALTYVSEEKWVRSGLQPKEVYRNFCIRGAEEFNLPQEYVNQFLKFI